MANNNILFNSAFAGAISAISSRWITSLTGSQYQNQILAAQAYATKVDELIATDPSYGEKEARLLESISHAFWNDRDPKFTSASDYITAAGPVVTLWTQSLSVLLPEPGSGGSDLPLVDGTQAAPSLSFLSDLSLGMWYKNAQTAGWAVGNSNFLDMGNDTIMNQDPISPAVVRYAMRGYQLPLAGVNETAFLYGLIDPGVGSEQQALIYVDITDNQIDTYGPAIKVIHDGHGDGIYVAQFSDGSGYENATWADSRGYISTIQIAGLTNATLFNAFQDQADIPNFGLFYADLVTANAYVVRIRDASAAAGLAQFDIRSQDNATHFWRAFNDGSTEQNSLPATAIVTTRDGPETRSSGTYWDGAVSREAGFTMKPVVTGAGVVEWRIYEDLPAGATLLAIIRKSGSTGQIDMQLGSLVNIASIQSIGNRDDYVDARLTVQWDPTNVDDEAGMLLMVRQGGADQVKRVTQGAADSGGAGFRQLLVPNG